MKQSFNDVILDISKLKWGERPVPPLPTALCHLWRDEALPTWLITETGLPESATVAALGPEYWASSSGVTPRLQHYIVFVIRTRAPSIKSIRCFERKWPVGLRMAAIPFCVRSMHLLLSSGLTLKPETLMEATFGQLLRIEGLGIKSLIEITTLTEAAIDLHERVTAGLLVNASCVPGKTIATASQVAETWINDLSSALQESWMDQISEQDSRFARFFRSAKGTLEERIERVMSDPVGASSDVSVILSSLPLIRQEVERVTPQFLEDSLMEFLSACVRHKQRDLEIIAARLGWLGEDPKTLQECGDIFGITRERVRQIEEKALSRFPSHPVFLPKLDLAISVLESAAPIPELKAQQLLVQNGISRRAFSATSILKTAEILGRKTTLSMRDLKGKRLVVAGSQGHTLGRVVRIARRLSGQAGVASVFQVVDYLNEIGEIDRLPTLNPQPVTEQEARRVLESVQECEFLDDDWFWFSDIKEGRNRLANVVKRILSVASPQSVPEVREGVRRAFRYRSLSSPRYRSLVVPPQAVMAAFFRRHPDFRIAEQMVSTVKQLDFRTFLGEGDQVLVDVLRSSSTGVLDRRTLRDGCLARGLNENTLLTYTTYSPILEHLGLDLWKLRGVRVDPVAVEAVREQNQLRPRENRLLQYGWTADAKLWIAWKLPGSVSGLVFGIPGAVRRYLCNRSFPVVGKEVSRVFGQIGINENGSSYGYTSYLRYAGADEGDTLLAEFDLAKPEVQLSITDGITLETTN